MEIARERFLDQGRDYHLTLAVRSRTTPMHSALTALTPEERERVAAVLGRALDEIAAVLGPHVPARAAG
jgi:truncated hemoglobin YjbI